MPEACNTPCMHDLSPAGAVALLLFFAFAMQCFSTIAVVRRETGGWKWPIFQFSYMLVLAYTSALDRLRNCGSFAPLESSKNRRL